jgi:ribosomal protein L7/L12
MNDSLLPVILVAIVVATTLRRTTSVERHLQALSRVEAKLDALLKHQGVRFDPYAEVPPSVVDALRGNRKIDAIKAYRTATGAGLRDAKEFVEEVERRAGSKL